MNANARQASQLEQVDVLQHIVVCSRVRNTRGVYVLCIRNGTLMHSSVLQGVRKRLEHENSSFLVKQSKVVCKSSETRFVMLCETLLENYYSSALNVFGSRKHDMECIRLLCYILANYSLYILARGVNQHHFAGAEGPCKIKFFF